MGYYNHQIILLFLDYVRDFSQQQQQMMSGPGGTGMYGMPPGGRVPPGYPMQPGQGRGQPTPGMGRGTIMVPNGQPMQRGPHMQQRPQPGQYLLH